MAHDFRFDNDVPQVPLPIVPVTTLKLVDGSVPLAVIVTGVALAMSHPLCPLALPWHSTRYTSSFGVKPVPDTFTASPFVKFVAGLTTNLGDVVVGALGLTVFEGFDLGPTPTVFLATTVNVYAVPFRSPATLHFVALVVHVLLAGCDVTT
jgi:hypothetical protein